jgi:hypothetical protein
MAATLVAQHSSHPFPYRFVRLLWNVHRAAYSISRGRLGLRRPAAGQWGMLHLTTTGRRTARKRGVILGYLEDGPDLITRP